MEVKGMKNLVKRIGAALLLCLVAFNVFAIDTPMNRIPGEAFGIHNSGNNQFERLENDSRHRHIRNDSRDVRILVRDTQGVAFVGIAKPEGDAVGQSVSLDYDAKRDDGDRLYVKIGAAPDVNSGLYDWEIVPIARYANGNYTSAVTFAGGTTDNDDQTLKETAEAAEKEGKRCFWISYHPDLDNTLVGYNLFLVDAMLTGAPINTKIKNFTDRSKNGTFPVIKGYNDYDYTGDESTVAEFAQKILEKRNDYNRSYEKNFFMPPGNTYIYSDGEMPITYQLNGGKVEFTGYPFYHNMVHVSNTWTLLLTNRSNRMFLPQVTTVTITKLPNLVEISYILKYLPQFDPLKAVSLLRYYNMGYEIENTKTKVEKNFDPIPELVDFMSTKESYEAMKLVNPVVFNSAERTCHWLAFFRSVKGDHENKTAEWKSFIKAVNLRYPEGSEDPAYSYETPRLWIAD
jgi:hypothetical protein